MNSELDLPGVDVGPELDNIRRWIKAARRVKHWTQIDLADRADVSVNTIGRFERGEGDMSLGVFIKIMYTLDMYWKDLDYRWRDDL